MADVVGRLRLRSPTQHNYVCRVNVLANPPSKRDRRRNDDEIDTLQMGTSQVVDPTSDVPEQQYKVQGDNKHQTPSPPPQRPSPHHQDPLPPMGFAGLPSDLCILPKFSHHISSRIWVGEGRERVLGSITHGKKISELQCPTTHLVWFWNHVHASSLDPLLMTPFKNVNSSLCKALTERWNEETSSFHPLVGDMTITLDDVSCLLHISIHGNLVNHMAKISQEQGVAGRENERDNH